MKTKEFKLDVLKQKRTIKQYYKYFTAGVICLIINLGILYFLTEFIGLFYIVSAIFAGIVSSSGNFIINKTWTFREDIEKKFVEKYFKFYVVRGIVFLVGVGLLFLLTEFLHVYYLVSQIIAVLITGFISFLAHKIWIFEKYKL